MLTRRELIIILLRGDDYARANLFIRKLFLRIEEVANVHFILTIIFQLETDLSLHLLVILGSRLCCGRWVFGVAL